MQRNTSKKVAEDTIDESDSSVSNRRRNQNQRENIRDVREDPNDYYTRLGHSSSVRREYIPHVEFGRLQQQQFQQRLQQHQLKETEMNTSSLQGSHRMGASLPSKTPSGSNNKRSSSEPPKRSDRYSLLSKSIQREIDETSLVSIPEELLSSDYYGNKDLDGRSIYTRNSGSARTSNCELDREDYSEVDAATSTTSGKLHYYSKPKGPAPPVPKSKSAKKDDKINKQALINSVRQKVSSTNEFEIGTIRGSKNSMFEEPTSNIQDENDPYLYEVTACLPTNRNSNSRGFQSSTTSFAHPSDRNSNYEMTNGKVGRVGKFGLTERASIPSLSSSKETLPLPIEIPDSVTDEDAFRRYLSVRRNASSNTQHVPFQSLAILQQHSNMGSTGSRGTIQRGKNSSSSRTTLSHRQGQLDLHRDAHKRTMSLSHAIMTLALLCASASQLRFLVAYSHAHSYPGFYYFLVCTCIIVEVIVGVAYVVLSRFSFDETRADQVHSYLIFGLFIVAVFNVIICVFAVDDHICEVLWKNHLKSSEMMDSIDQNLPI